MVDAVLLAAIESEGRRLVDTARRDPDRKVPQYPNWSLADLVSHTASVHALATRVVRDLPDQRVTRPTLPHERNPIEWGDQKLTELIAVIRHADTQAPVWGFGQGSTVGHWVRRMVVETGVHRWDAQQAFGDQKPLKNLVAQTALDEFSDMWLPLITDAQTLQVTATDIERTWVYGTGTPTASVAGTASDVYLALMARPSPVVLPDDWLEACSALPPPPET